METMKIIVKCPKCSKRVFDKVKGATGIISIKCPHCGNIVEVDLSLRKNRPLYRIVKPSA